MYEYFLTTDDFPCTNNPLKIVWDETKRQTNRTKHGLDFADLNIDFFMNAMIAPAKDPARFGSDLGHLDAPRKPKGKEAPMTRFSSKRPLTDEEEAEIQKRIASDPDAPEATDEQLARAKPFAEAFPDLADSIKRSRGRPKVANAREAVTLRLNPETLAKFKAKGDDWRTVMVEVLDKAKV